MAENDGQERTEQPTARKLARARDEGQVARSPDLSGAAVLLGGTILLAGTAGRAFSGLARSIMNDSFGALAVPDVSGSVGLLQSAAGRLLATAAPIFLLMAALAALIGWVQLRGFMVTLGPVTPKISNVDPMQGIKRIFSPESVVTLLKSIVKLAVIGSVTVFLIKKTMPDLLSLPEMGVPSIGAIMTQLAIRFGILLGVSYLVLGALDWFWQSFRMNQRLKMSRQEVVMEHRETEGNPQVKARIVGMARALARRRMLSKVSAADVIVTNPTHIAVALKYDPAIAPAPIVLAMGQRKLAERIRELGKKAGVPLVENRPVARALLATATVGAMVPPALYAAVAEILAFVFRRRKGAGVSLPVAERRSA